MADRAAVRVRPFDPRDGRPTVLHVTESLGAGVGLSLARLTRLQEEAGATCVVLATRRYDTPDSDELANWFGANTELVLHPGGISSRRQLLWLSRELLRLLRTRPFDAVHLHSSFAGVIGRTLPRFTRRRPPVFYSPHGFAFLREDLPRSRRTLVHLAERVLARLDGRLLLVSDSELEVARRQVGGRVGLLRNGVDLSRFRPEPRLDANPRLRVVMIGRIAYQKAPWRFADAARRFSDLADFEWLGYGEPQDRTRWLDDSPVSVSGPLVHEDLLSRLQGADVVYFPTLWEGMPLSLIEAQACGVPAVASAIDGNRDVIIDGETGYLRAGEDELLDALERILTDPTERRRLAEGAARSSDRFSDRDRGIRSLALYSGGSRG